jgi:anaerobic selenocysteine-containing dehydrogenase
MSKLFQESSLRDLPGTIRMNPETASSLGLEGGAAVLLMTAMGTMPARLRTDQGVRPGVVLAPVAPAPGGTPGARGPDQRVLDLCDVREDGTWRMTRASVRKA